MLENGKDVYIRKGGVLRNHDDAKQLILIGIKESDSRMSVLYVTNDGGKSFSKVDVGFQVKDTITFHPENSKILGCLSTTADLYISTDAGVTWTKKHEKISKFKWLLGESGKGEHVLALYDPDMRPSLFSGMASPNDDYKLIKSIDHGQNWQTVIDRVYTFGSNGKFMYASIYDDDNHDLRLMKVSTDEGTNWRLVQLPSITKDRFYSILDMNEGLVFMHVDNPGDTGHGTIYSSDSTGAIFSESLKRHLYPNFGSISDFYRVLSLPGVYISSQMNEDKSIHSVITFDRGGEWRRISVPDGMKCKDMSKPCSLQIHNLYSIARGIKANPPMSSENAVGIILAHGNIGESLQTTPPDVYVTSDGGYSWIKALDGPHHYNIAAQGALLVAISAHTPFADTIKFSTDEGRCWHEYKYTTEQIQFTGLITEPKNKALHILVFGFGIDKKWRVINIDFSQIITEKCKDSDYEKWAAHSDMKKDSQYKGCLLGKKSSFWRLKKDSWCLNSRDHEPQKQEDPCQCTKADYECDFGYTRPVNQQECTRDSRMSKLDFCVHQNKEELITQGYRKIPGDVCVGGFVPEKDHLVNLFKKCTSEDDKNVIFNDMQISRNAGNSKNKISSTSSVLLALATVAAIAALVIFGIILYKKCSRGPNVRFTYSSLHQNDTDDHYDYDNTFNGTSVLYDETDEEVETSKLPASKHTTSNGRTPKEDPGTFDPFAKLSKPKAGKPILKNLPSYHDVSDDDMLD